ncbi:MAG: phosphoribosylaminoimidazolesuccinocarboxamide synthase [Verrucomicrobia bacterium]|nr:phosphoribosylaminoimidazolesuccinocarboxamide synthase [Verrucomicrobiota bacterium]
MTLLECNLPGIPKLRSGKVREVFDLGDSLLIVATDRISAFDCILPTGIPRKGEVLTQMTAFWYGVLDFVPNHFLTARFEAFPAVLHPFEAQLRNRSMLVRKANPLPVECVARGHIAGSGWKEYQTAGTVGGHEVPAGLLQSAKLPAPLFTPSTKAESGHDENITWKECRRILGDELAIQVRDLTIDLYEHGCAHASRAGILIADTKFEFGLADGELILIDECLTPDSSRFWPANLWNPGSNPPSYDKQFVRDYLETLDWDKTPPAPELPADVAEKTSAKYIEAFEQLTGLKLP